MQNSGFCHTKNFLKGVWGKLFCKKVFPGKRYTMYIDAAGKKWFKGNIHTHTTVSDGRMAPEDSIALYLKNGYDFLALTDQKVTGLNPVGVTNFRTQIVENQ